MKDFCNISESQFSTEIFPESLANARNVFAEVGSSDKSAKNELLTNELLSRLNFSNV